MKNLQKIILVLSIIMVPIPSGFPQNLMKMGEKALESYFWENQGESAEIKINRSSKIGKFTVLESDNPPGFIIYREEKSGPVIFAYSTNNQFSEENNINHVSLLLLEGLTRKYHLNNQFKSGISSKIPIGPLLKTKWNQDEWFNRCCPYNILSEAGENTYAGCVGVAMGQILKYYGPWNNFKVDDSHNYLDETLVSSGIPYDWAGMIEQPLNYDLEISRLLSDLGILIKTTYGNNTSVASTGLARVGLNNIGFCGARKVERQNFDENGWLQLIYSNIKKYHPVLVAGNGHAFVCDGYDQNGMLHFNLGGGGTGDGYYSPEFVFGRYCTNEAILDIYPENDFLPVQNLRIQEINKAKHVVWTPPEGSANNLTFRIYMSDDDYIETKDTTISATALKPGTRGLMVSALYSEGESLWIGPVWINNPGDTVTITDPALIKALLDNPDQDTNSSSMTASMGDIADLLILKIDDPVGSTRLIHEMESLQVLEINAQNLDEGDLDFLGSLKHLQTLRLKNLTCDNFSLPGQLPKLVELELDNCNLKNLGFLNELSNLVVLKLKGGSCGNICLPAQLNHLETLMINDMELTDTGFPGNYHNLRNLDLSYCKLNELEITGELNRLICINLNNNLFGNIDFLKFLPCIKSFCASNNNLTSLDLRFETPYLKVIDLSNNEIDSVHAEFILNSIDILDLSFNRFTNFPDITGTMEKLNTLNISNNLIETISEIKLPHLVKMDLSSNKLKHINGISIYDSLRILDLSDNIISDFFPLLQEDFYKQLEYLDILGDPVSKESFLEVIPALENAVKDFRQPDEYQPGSPCFPAPESGSHLTEGLINISWQCENYDPEIRFNLFFGVGDSIRLIKSGIPDRSANIFLNDGQVYNWQVQSVLPDTSFYSGFYEIRTTSELEIPFFEDFESYYPGDKITEVSQFWRLSNGPSGTPQDAEITEINQEKGKSNSLKLNSRSNVTMDLEHIESDYLIIKYEQLADPEGSSNICLNNIDGLQINIITSLSGSRINVNGRLASEFHIIPEVWNTFRIVIHGRNGHIIIRCNDQEVFYRKWHFKDDMAKIESLVFKSARDGLSSENNSSCTFLDNFSINDSNQISIAGEMKVVSPSLKVFPNPASDHFYLEGLPDGLSECNIRLINTAGQTVLSQKVSLYEPETKISTRNLADGIYHLVLTGNGLSPATQKILISK